MEAKSSKLPRGLRNNNPLNLRISASPWQGKITPNTDGQFEQFKTLELGIRAAMVNLRTLIRRDHIERVCDIIHKWAPPTDHNNTEKYIERVCEIASIGRTDRIMAANRSQVCRLLWAMAQVECGCVIEYGRFEIAWSLI